MHAHIQAIPSEEQRYPTSGDWWFSARDGIEVKVTEQRDWRYEFLVGLHELIEAALCKARGVEESDVTDFDRRYEETRTEGDLSEPGNDPSAPYHREHMFATLIETQVARQLGVDWDEYDSAVGDC